MVTAGTQSLLAITTTPVSRADLAPSTYNAFGWCDRENVSTARVDRVLDDGTYRVTCSTNGRTGFHAFSVLMLPK